MRGPFFKLLILSSGVQLLAGCNDGGERASDLNRPERETAVVAAPAPEAKAAPKAQSPAAPAKECRGAACRVLTKEGWAGMRAGMTVAEAEKASGLSFSETGIYDELYADEPESLGRCNAYQVKGAPQNLSVFVEDGIVTSVSVVAPEGSEDARFVTDRGVALGDTEQAVRRAYDKLDEEPDIYSEPPDKKLFVRGADGNGIRFSIREGKVVDINVGGASISYVEGCL